MSVGSEYLKNEAESILKNLNVIDRNIISSYIKDQVEHTKEYKAYHEVRQNWFFGGIASLLFLLLFGGLFWFFGFFEEKPTPDEYYNSQIESLNSQIKRCEENLRQEQGIQYTTKKNIDLFCRTYSTK